MAQENVVQLEPALSFGDKGYYLFTLPQYIAFDEQNSIYVSDIHGRKIFEFDLKGNFERILGREGRGPGEYQSPSAIGTNGEKLFVHDPPNRRITCFFLNSDSSYTVRTKRSFLEFEIYNDKIFSFAPPGMKIQASLLNENERLITVFDENLEKQTAFGEYLNVVKDMPAGLSWPLIEIENNIIHTAFKYFPFYLAYSPTGELLMEIDISKLTSIENPLSNTDEDNYSGTRPSGFSSVFKAMDVFEDRIFLARTGNYLFIDEFKFGEDTLTYVRSYTYDNLPDVYYVSDFFYHKDTNSFYILEYDEVLKVTVYSLPD